MPGQADSLMRPSVSAYSINVYFIDEILCDYRYVGYLENKIHLGRFAFTKGGNVVAQYDGIITGNISMAL